MNNLGIHVSRLDHFQFFDFHNLRRGELFNFRPEDIPEITRLAENLNLDVSIHCPLIKPEWYNYPPTWTFLSDVDDEKRETNLKMVEQTLHDAAPLHPQYIVVHFPSPISPEAVDVSVERHRESAMATAYRLSELSQEHGIPLHLEGFGPSPVLDAAFLSKLLEEFPSLRYCLDVAHTHISSQRDGFEYYKFVEDLLPHIGSLHLWNTRNIDDYVTYRHIPLHPSQLPEEGWVDIEKILSIVLKAHPNCPVILEQGGRFPDEIQKYVKDVREGVKWIKQIIAEYTSQGSRQRENRP